MRRTPSSKKMVLPASDLGVDEAISTMSGLAAIHLPDCLGSPPARWRILLGRLVVRMRTRSFRGEGEEAAAEEFVEDVLPSDLGSDFPGEAVSLHEERLRAVATAVEHRASAIAETADTTLARLDGLFEEAVIEFGLAREALEIAERGLQAWERQASPEQVPGIYHDDDGRRRRTPPAVPYRAKITLGALAIVAAVLAELAVNTNVAIDVLWVDPSSPFAMATAYSLACVLTVTTASFVHLARHGTSGRKRLWAGAAFVAMSALIADSRGSLAPVGDDLLLAAGSPSSWVDPIVWLACLAAPYAVSLGMDLASAGVNARNAGHAAIRTALASAILHADLQDKVLAETRRLEGWKTARTTLPICIERIRTARRNELIRLRENGTAIILEARQNMRKRSAAAAASRRLARGAADRRRARWGGAPASTAIGLAVLLLSGTVSAEAAPSGDGTTVVTHVLCAAKDDACSDLVLGGLAAQHVLLPGAGMICLYSLGPAARGADLVGCREVLQGEKALRIYGHGRTESLANYRRIFRDSFRWDRLADRATKTLPEPATRVVVPSLDLTLEGSRCDGAPKKASYIVCDTSGSSSDSCTREAIEAIFRTWTHEECPRTYTVHQPANGGPAAVRWMDAVVPVEGPLLERAVALLKAKMELGRMLDSARPESGSDLATAVNGLAPLLESGVESTVWLLSDLLQQAVHGLDWSRDRPNPIPLVGLHEGAIADVRLCQPAVSTRVNPALRSAARKAWAASFERGWKGVRLSAPGRCP